VTARRLAADVLLQVERDGAFASAALSAALAREPDLDPRDRALATELVYGVLRWRGILRETIGRQTPRGITKLDPAVRAHLEIAAYQILRMDRIPAAAAVDEAVSGVKRQRGERMGGFANAVLRKVAADPARPDEDERARLALPAWLSRALRRDLGAEDARAVALASLAVPRTFLRANVRKTTCEALAERIHSERPGARATRWAGAPGALEIAADGDLQALPSFREGLFTVQDAAAQAVAALVRPRPGERILDACAGRGGKTGALVELAGGPVEVDAADDHPGKLERLVSEMARLGHAGVRTVAVDLAVGAGGLAPPYDAVLVDAPCTGTGVLARRPEIRWRLVRDDAARLAEVQRTILSRAAGLVRPGGRLVYAVCSLLAAEGPQVTASLGAEWTMEGEHRWLPHREGTDGFYAVVWARRP
jgi:16S rRNA (cytosine967-C5)-methyltransferase